MKVLIAYSTRYGSTAEVAEVMGDILSNHGFDIDIINLQKQKGKLDIASYDGYIVGAGIRIGRWTKQSKHFLKRYKKQLNQKKLAVFVSCGDASDPKGCETARKKYIEPILDKLELRKDQLLYDAVGGKLDLTDESKIGFFFKKIMKMAAEDDEDLDPVGKNDLRDWDRIKEFTLDFATRVNKWNQD